MPGWGYERGMRIVLQKVSDGSVDVIDELTGERDPTFEPQRIGVGYVLLVGVEDSDGAKQIAWLAHKISNLRVFEDDNGKMNRSIIDAGGEILLVSQFTLYGDARHGKRPSFIRAARPEKAIPLYEKAIAKLGEKVHVETGIFGAEMKVQLINDGPVTILLDSERTF